MKKYMAFRYKQ